MNEDEKNILEVLAKSREDRGGAGINELDDLAQRTNLSRDQAKRVLNGLRSLGLVKPFSLDGVYGITDEGYRVYRQFGENSTSTGGVNINISGGVHGSAIAAGGSQATVTNNGVVFFTELQKQIEASSIPDEEKKGLLQDLKKLALNPWVTTLAGVALGKVLGG